MIIVIIIIIIIIIIINIIIIIIIIIIIVSKPYFSFILLSPGFYDASTFIGRNRTGNKD